MTDLNKKQKKRWGKKFIDRRDWQEYNEELVKVGEYMLDMDWVESWDDELVLMNEGKVGAPYKFPKSLIELQAIWHAKSFPLRAIEGMTRDLCKIGQLPNYNDYSTANRRMNQLDYTLDLPTSESIAVFSDGTGLQAVAGGEYLREKYGKKNRRWVQIIILGDPVTKEPVSYEVNIIQESEADSTKRQAEDMLVQGVSISALGGDGAMDQMALWNFIQEQGIAAVIKPDKNALDDTDNILRNKHVKERKKSYRKWARKHKYGLRWPATEGVFSAIKRIFGETLRATSEIGMIKEASAKIWAYKKIKQYAKA
jgi:Transposase DDE domain